MHSVNIVNCQEDLVRIYILRYAVYVEEMGFPFPQLEQNPKMLYDKFDKTATQFFIEDDQFDVIGIYRLNILDFSDIDPELEERYSISRFKDLGLIPTYSSKLMIHQKHRNLCTVQSLLRFVFDYGVQRNYFLNFIDCSPDLVGFYERMGYRKYTNDFIDPILGEKTPLVLLVPDLNHLRKMRSPLLRVC